MHRWWCEFGRLSRDDGLLTFLRIESMKMETVIRSPQDGVIKKLAHREGVSASPATDLRANTANSRQDICKAGTVLVLFEEEAKEG